MGKYDDSTKKIIIISVIIIILTFLPWWSFFTEAVPDSGDRLYSLYSSNPFYGNFLSFIYFFAINANLIDLAVMQGTLYDTDVLFNMYSMIGVIMALAGGIIGVCSMGKKKVALVGGLLAIGGASVYMLMLYVGIMPPAFNYSAFQGENLNPIWGSFSDTNILAPGTNFNHYFGVSIGCIGCLITGILLFIFSFKGKD